MVIHIATLLGSVVTILAKRLLMSMLGLWASAVVCAFSFTVIAAVASTSLTLANAAYAAGNSTASNPAPIKIVTTIQQQWQFNLLKEALRRSGQSYQVEQMSTQMNQKRKVEEALAGTVDVFWSMTSKELEETVLPVRIPLFKGLLGNRLLIIRKTDEARFANVKTLADFKQLKAGQNRYWPDASILEANGLPVVTSYQYTNLYPMLEGGRFDYLALGAQEIGDELASHPDPALKIDTHILLQYRSPAYFFVSPKRPELAAAILAGLENMISDGSFDEMFNRELKIDKLYRDAQFEQRVIIRLDTPDLSPLTPIERQELWLDLFSMQGAK
ncbi:transporter substrate-binding domain-containing protein [Shewanella sp. FJAT-51649]|uniref:substrate-binding periplasmic protein n=1 Tax=Shewanella sp. FJAT-51649 TaxID=2864210 RepID=UPI001C65970C|nr:transporter substrate-binding domain-containing protein [Shewanella sp. FJAT-51649]QYJ70471.1 transporter substrate-binding domain-containing protein [Shewanella sp. FJAT-51649]